MQVYFKVNVGKRFGTRVAAHTLLLSLFLFSDGLILPFTIWLQQYARSDWQLSGHYFLVMTGHYENFSRLDGSFEL